MKKNLNIQYILSGFIVLLYAYKLFKINTGLDSLYDEGHLLVRLWQVRHGIIHEGLSQWPVMVYRFFGETLSSDILLLRWIGSIWQIVSLALFSFLSLVYLTKKQLIRSVTEKIMFVNLVFLLGYLCFQNLIIHYNQLQASFMMLIIACFLLADTVTGKTKIAILYFSIGVLCLFALFTILPSGVVALFFILLFTWLRNRSAFRTSLLATISLILGMVTALLFYHIFILDLRTVYENMQETAAVITNLNRGYDPLSFLHKMLVYLKDFFITSLLLLGLLSVSMLMRKKVKDLVILVFFFFSIVIFGTYQVKPLLMQTTLLAFPLVVLLLYHSYTDKTIFSIKGILLLFLFFFPLFSSLGTNVYYGGKIAWFVVPWSVLFMMLIANNDFKEKYRKETGYFLLMFFLFVAYQPAKALWSELKQDKQVYVFDSEEPIAKMHLTPQQKAYFDEVHGILISYNYVSKKDVIFATQLDHMTIYAMDAVPCATHHQPMDFLADTQKHQLNRPDFIFLTKFDLSLITDSLKALAWEFPDEYDKYYVGTPETKKTGYPTERWLYCRKDRIAK
jgi:hypothetical protein